MTARASVAPRWARLDDAELLRLRFRDLSLTISDSPVHADTLRLGAELEQRGLRFTPHFWFSTEWFSPDGVPGIAVPFFAQSHPTEDFAETFAVWLSPSARWRAEYAGWPALGKLEFVDGLMSELAGRTPSNRDRSVVAPLTDNNRTLREHYRRRADSMALGDERYDAALMRVFAPRRAAGALAAERFLDEIKPQLKRTLLRRTAAHPYVVYQVLRGVRRRTRALDLVLRGARRDAARQVVRLHERVIADLLRRNEVTYFS